MRLRILVNLSLLSLAGPAAWAQTLPADEFFHSGAQAYLTNNIARAREEVDNGLKIYPDDIKLKKLDELLKQQSQQQQSKNDQQKQEQKKDDQQKQAKQDQKDQKGEKQSPEQKDQQKQEQQSKSSGEKKDEDKQSPQPMQAHAMTPKEAQQLLDAQKGEEQFLQFKPAERAERPTRPIKDW